MRIIKHVSALLTIVYMYIGSGYAQTSPSPLVPMSGTKACKAPPQPQNGHWKLHRSQYSNIEQDCDISEGMNLGLCSYLTYSCNPGYKIKGSMDVSCIEGKWLNIPSCIEIRCRKLSTTSIIAHCIYNNELVSCDYPVLPGTSAKLSCRDSYQYESNLPSRRRNFARCNENGQWVPQPIICVPDITVTSVRFVKRIEWGAQPPFLEVLTKLKLPVPYVIISYTGTDFCETQSECTIHVRFVQSFHIESRKWADIAYNFLVGGDGLAYVGRSWDYVGAHSFNYNNKSIGISLIGTFHTVTPSEVQIQAAQTIIELGVKAGKIAPNYKLLVHGHISKNLDSEDALYSEIQTWPHWSSLT